MTMDWKVKRTTDEDTWLADYIAKHLNHYVALPPVVSRLGAVEATWEEIDPGVALIRVEGGTIDDRALLHYLVRTQLAHHGVEHAQFEVVAGQEIISPRPALD